MKQKFLLNALLLLLFVATGSMVIAQPTWNYTNTGANHTILLNGPITINGTAISSGDYIGVFFDDAGVLKCGGYVQWPGSTTAVTAWGNDSGTNPIIDGFGPNEAFNWKVWRASDGVEVDMIATFAFGPTGYLTQGVSGIASLVGTYVQTGLATSGTVVDLTCYGLCTGTIDLTVTGGVTPYTYVWSNGAATEDLANLCTGTYDVTITDAAGGGSTTMPWSYINTGANHTILLQAGSILVNSSALASGDYIGLFYDSVGVVKCGGYVEWLGTTTAVSAWGNDSGTNPTVDGFATGEAFTWKVWKASDGAVVDMTATYAFGPTTYSTQGVSSVAAMSGTYTPSGANTASTSFTVTGPDSIVVAGLLSDYSGYSVSVNGATDGSIDLTVTGGTSPFSYIWSNAATSEDLTSLGAGPYDVTVLDANGCSASASFLLTEPAAANPLTGSGVQTNVSCNSVCDGTIDLTVSGGTTPFAYAWSTGAITEDLTGLCAGQYDVTITDASSTSLVMPWAYANTGANHTILVPAGSVIVNGVAADVGDVIGVFFYNENNVLTCGGYVDYQGTTTAISAWGNDSGTNPVLDGFANGEAFNWKLWRSSDGSVVDMTAVYGGGLTTYTTQGITQLATLTGSYVPPSGSNPVILSFTITEPAAITTSTTFTDVLCNGGATGSIDLTAAGGTAPLSYLWSNVAITEDLTGLVAGTYMVTVTDASGCTAVETVVISEPAVLVLTGTPGNATCFGAADGSVDLTVTGGSAAYSYAWSNGGTSEDLNGLIADSYSVTVTDANGCTATYSTVVTEPDAVMAVASITNILCNGAASGAIDLTVSGGTAPYSYVWTNGASTMNIAGLTAGNYVVTITDVNGCTFSASYTVAQPAALSLSISSSNPLCFGGAGSIDLTVNGGTATYTYLWSNGSTLEDITSAPEGLYSVTVTDANGCTATGFDEMFAPAAISFTTLLTDASCNGYADGAVDLTVSGGSMPYGVNWDNGALTEDISGLVAGTYAFTITDANQCTANGSVAIAEPAVLALSSVLSDYAGYNVSVFGASDGSINLTVSGGTAAYTYLWSNAATTEDLNGLAAGPYDVTVTDANGCSQSASFTLTEPVAANIVLTTLVTNVTCFGGTDGAVDLTVSGGTSPYTYLWGGGETTEDLSGLPTGIYNVTVTDVNSITATTSAHVLDGAVVTVDLGVDQTVCDGVMVTLDAGTFASYLWNGGEMTQTVVVTAAGIYMVTVTDANGCTATDDFGLVVLPVFNTTDAMTICDGDSYLFGTQTLTASGQYTEVFMAANGCDSTVVLDFTVNPVYNTVDAMAICDGDSYTFGTQTLTATGQYTEVFMAANGCDSTVVLNFMVYPVYNTVDAMTICDGDSYQFGTQLLTTTGQYTEVFMSADGCDSTVVLDFMVYPVYNTADAMTICDGDSYQFGTQLLTTTGQYTEVFMSADGCDSTVVLDFMVNPVFNTSDAMTICDGDSYLFGTQTLMLAGQYTEVFMAANGCDSTVVLDLTVNPVFNTADAMAICDGDSYQFGTQLLTTTGQYTEVFMSADGCDSTVVLDFMVYPVYNTADAMTICDGDSYQFGTQLLTTTGQYTEVFMSADGCDSTVVFDLTVNPVYNTTDAMTICDGDTYMFGTQSLMLAGQYTEVFMAANGCDSTVVLDLMVNPVLNMTDAATICAGDVYVLGTQTLTTAGQYTEVFMSVLGCDSTVVFDLTVNPVPVVDLGADVAVCNGALVTLDAGVFNAYAWSTGATTQTIDVGVTGNFSVTVTDANGCVGSDDMNLSVNSLPIVDLGPDVEIYAGDQVVFNAGVYSTYLWSTAETTQSITVTAEGNYSVVVTDANGCNATDDVNVAIIPELLSIDLVKSTDLTTWMPIAGTLATGFEMDLDPAVTYYSINAVNAVTSAPIAPGMYGFYFSSTPTDFFTYWASRGVDGTPTGGWEDHMWLIINGNAPLFYYKVDALGALSMVDGLQYDFASNEVYLLVNGDYLTGDYMFSGTLTGVNGVDSDPVVVDMTFSGEDAAIQAAIDGTIITMPALVSELYMDDVVFTIDVDYPLPFSINLPVDLLTDAYVELPTMMTAGAIASVQYNGIPVGSYTFTGLETALWISEALGMTRNPLYAEIDAIWTVSISGLMPGNYTFDVTSVTAIATGFANPLDWIILDTGSTAIEVYTIAPDITAMIPVDQSILSAWATLTITVDNPDDDLTQLEVDVTKIGSTGSGSSGQWAQFTIPTDQAIIAQINTAYAGIAQVAYANGVFTLDINTEATPNPFLNFAGWGDGEYIFWYVAYDEYGNQSGYWGDPANPVDNITYFIETIYDEQFIALPAGYSVISTFIDPAAPNASDVFSQIASEVILVKDEAGNPFWPAFGLNNVGNLTIGEGYIVNMATAQTLLVQGTQIVPEIHQIFLPTGWSLFGYLRATPASIITMLNTVATDVIVVKTGTGEVYWPAFGFNSIGDLTPGVGYKVRMYNDAYLTYPANTAAAAKSNINILANSVYTNVKNTGHNMTLGLPAYIWNESPAIGDEIGIYAENGQLVGASVYQGDYVATTVWGNDDLTTNVDGLLEGETYSIKLYRVNENVEETYEITTWTEGNGMYADDAIVIAGKLESIALTGSVTLGQNTPNPANISTEISFFLPQDENVTISVYNILGEKLEDLVSSEFNSGNHTILLDVSKYAVGTYMYKLTTDTYESTRKMNVIR